MKISFKQANTHDIPDLKNLAIKAWSRFQPQLTPQNWTKLYNNLNSNKTYEDLLHLSKCIICTTNDNLIIGMVFLVPSNNPTDIYDKDWSVIRFLSVNPEYSGKEIGKKLILKCIEEAKRNGEKIMALHTSEMMQAAIHIYESLGFMFFKEIDPRFGKRYWLYKLDLNT